MCVQCNQREMDLINKILSVLVLRQVGLIVVFFLSLLCSLSCGIIIDKYSPWPP